MQGSHKLCKGEAAIGCGAGPALAATLPPATPLAPLCDHRLDEVHDGINLLLPVLATMPRSAAGGGAGGASDAVEDDVEVSEHKARHATDRDCVPSFSR